MNLNISIDKLLNMISEVLSNTFYNDDATKNNIFDITVKGVNDIQMND